MLQGSGCRGLGGFGGAVFRVSKPGHLIVIWCVDMKELIKGLYLGVHGQLYGFL